MTCASTFYSNEFPSLQEAVSHVASVGGKLIVSGSYTLCNKIRVVTSKSISIAGIMSRFSVLTWTNADGGIDITYTDDDHPPHVSGLSLKNSGLCEGTALSITGPKPALSTLQGSILNDLDISGTDVTADCWRTGIYMYECWYPHLSDIYIKGQTTITVPMAATFGINMDTCDVVRIDNTHIIHADVAIYQSGANQGEGFKAYAVEAIGCNYGIVLTGNSGNDSGTSIMGCELNCYTTAIDMTNRNSMSIMGNLINKTGGGTPYSIDWIGIRVINGGGNKIIGNTFLGNPAAGGATTAVQLGGTTSKNMVSGNTADLFNSPGYLAFLSDSANDNTVSDNRGYSNVMLVLNVSSGSNNRLSVN